MPRRLHKPLAEWSPEDVQDLINTKVEEGQRLEYKSELDLDGRKQRREAAKDVSGMANAQGGLLIYGVAEEELPDGRRLPKAPTPLTDGAAQARLEDVLDSAVTPRLNMELHQLALDTGGYFLLVRAFQRFGVPHMVDAYDDKRCYVRVGLKTRPMEQHELEAAFQAASLPEAAVARRLARLPLVPRLHDIEVVAREKKQSPGPWASVVTLPLDAPDPLLEMRTASPTDFRDDGDHERWYREPLLWGAYSWDAHGYVIENQRQDAMTYRVRLYRNGTFEWGGSYGARGDALPSRSFTQQAHDALAYFATVYERVGYFGRARVWVSLDDVEGTELGVSPDFYRYENVQLAVPRLEWVATENVERLLTDITAVVHAAMDRFWVAYGFKHCLQFDENGAYEKGR